MNVDGREVTSSMNNRIVKITVADNAQDKLSTTTLRFCLVYSTENRLLLSNEEVCFNIAHINLTIYSATEVVCHDTGLITFYMLLGPAIRKGHRIKKNLLFLYAVDNAFQLCAVSSYCLPPEVELSDQCRFHIISGPKICFCNANEIFILSTDDVLMKYQMLSDLQLLSCWSTEEWLLCSGLRKSFDQNTFANAKSLQVLYVDLIRSSLHECTGNLIPEVYAGLVTCMLLMSIEMSVKGSNMRVIDSSMTLACTSYSQMVECVNGRLVNCLALPFNDSIQILTTDNTMETFLIVLSQTGSAAIINKNSFQVLWVLAGVDKVLLGDFVNCGSTQALFLAGDPTSESPDDMDMLALIDADMEGVNAKHHFADKFLLTDFAQTHIDCWTSPKAYSSLTTKSDNSSSVSTMFDAISALRCRLSAGCAQLSAAKLECEAKRSLATETLVRLANVESVQPNWITPGFPLITIEEGASTSDRPSSMQVDRVESLVAENVWNRIVNNRWILGVTVHNNSSRSVHQVHLLLVPINSSHTLDLSFNSKCLSHNFRLPPDSASKHAAEECVNGRSDNSRPETDSESKNHVRTAACGDLLSKRRLKQTDEILPGHTAHVVASCLLLADETVIVSDITYKLILSWKQIGDNMDSCNVSKGSCTLSKSCGLVSMSAEALMNQDLYLPLQPGWPATDIQQLHFKLCLEAVHSATKTVNVCCVSDQCEMINVHDRLQSMYSALISQHQFVDFVETVGCLICINQSSSLYLGCVEAICVKHFNTIKLRLSVRDGNQLMFLLRVLYDCVPNDVIILPANQRNVSMSVNDAIQSLCKEISTSASSGTPMTSNSSHNLKNSNYSSQISHCIRTDMDVLRMLKQLSS